MDLKEALKVVVHREIPSDDLTPITVFHALAQKGSCILESAPEAKEGRYSYIGIDPIAVFSARGTQIEERLRGTEVKRFEADPYEALRAMQERMRPEGIERGALFAGGAVGFLTYDAVRVKEKIPERHPDLLHLPDFFFQFYKSSVSFDHETGRVLLSTWASDREEGHLELDCLEMKLKGASSLPRLGTRKGEIEVHSDFTDGEFAQIVEEAKESIRAGDVFQIVLSRTFQVKMDVKPFQVYRALRKVSPAPFLFYFDLEGFAIAGASPEQLISVRDGLIQSTPIAGTRPKGTPAAELLGDLKERAEHMMLVDLARNDVGAVAAAGTVKMAGLKEVHHYSHLIHLVSRVEAKLAPNFDALDALKASFPAGTLSGAPKVRAMELIDALEKSRRGLYGGAIVALDAFGNLTSCIVIRTAFLQGDQAFIRTGAGIVFDSDPIVEVAETHLKAAAVLDALRLAEGGRS